MKDVESFWTNSDLIPSREAAICYARADIKYLADRVRDLEEALLKISKEGDLEYIETLCKEALSTGPKPDGD